MKTFYGVVIFLLSASGSPELVAEQLFAVNKTELIQELISSSGLEGRIVGLPPLINRMMVQGIIAAGDPNEVSEPVRHIVTSTFRASSIRKRLVVELASNLTVEDLQNTSVFFKSCLGREIVDLEREASLYGKYSEITDMSNQLQQVSRNNPVRARLIEKLDAATFGSVMAIDLADRMRLGVGHSLLSGSMQFDEDSRAGLEDRINAAHFRLRGRITQQIFITYLYLFEKMRDEDLVTYLEFAESNPGRKYFLAIKKGFNAALNDAFQTTDKLLVERVKSSSSS